MGERDSASLQLLLKDTDFPRLPPLGKVDFLRMRSLPLLEMDFSGSSTFEGVDFLLLEEMDFPGSSSLNETDFLRSLLLEEMGFSGSLPLERTEFSGSSLLIEIDFLRCLTREEMRSPRSSLLAETDLLRPLLKETDSSDLPRVEEKDFLRPLPLGDTESLSFSIFTFRILVISPLSLSSYYANVEQEMEMDQVILQTWSRAGSPKKPFSTSTHSS